MKRLVLLAGAVAIGLATTVHAQSPFDAPLTARKGIMAIIQINMGTLSGMVRGKTDYDAAAAETAAKALLGVSMVDLPSLYPDGSDEMSIDGTRAGDQIWADMVGFGAEWAKFQAAAPSLAEEAGKGKDALSAAIGGVGGTCKSCHMTYRTPKF